MRLTPTLVSTALALGAAAPAQTVYTVKGTAGAFASVTEQSGPPAGPCGWPDGPSLGTFRNCPGWVLIGLRAADSPPVPSEFESVLACAGPPPPCTVAPGAAPRAVSPSYTASSLRESLPQSWRHPSSSRSESLRFHSPSSIPGVCLTLFVFHLQALCHIQ